MIKKGTTGIGDYSGKFKELCKPCFQAKQRAENHGHEHKRHPNGRPGEHLHSDLAVLSTRDLNGNKYVLTVVDEISQEIICQEKKKRHFWKHLKCTFKKFDNVHFWTTFVCSISSFLKCARVVYIKKKHYEMPMK
jgi:hypothetical protein